jgi:hypothetical protein
MSRQERKLNRLHKLRTEHEASTGAGPEEQAPGFIEDEMVTRNSYELAVREALEDGVLTEEALAAEGLPKELEQSPPG